MKTEIVYDGNIARRRVSVLRNLSKLSADGSLYSKLREAELRVEEKDKYVKYVEENHVKCHMLFDAMVGKCFYDVLIVGDFGLAFKGPEINPVFEGYEMVYAIEEPDDLQYLKAPLFQKNWYKYETMVLESITRCDIMDMVDTDITLDENMFLASPLWQELELRRNMLAEKFGCEPHVIYRVRDVLNLLNLLKDEPDYGSPIAFEYQKMILGIRDKYLLSE